MIQGTGNSEPRVVAAINEAVHLNATKQTELAVQLLSTVVEEYPQASAVHGYLAWFLLSDGRIDEAIGHGRSAIRLSPNSENASLIYFHVLWRTGRHIEALDEMKRFLTNKPSQQYANMIKDWQPPTRF